MILRFNGMYSKVGGHGCRCHGARPGKITFVTNKSFILPSGRRRTFHLGEVYEVSEEDGNFLLSYTFTDKDGAVFNAFTKVQ